MFKKQALTFRIQLHLSGPIAVAEQVCREFCLRGLCVTIQPTRFIYAGGEEDGYVVGLLNYPRFPTTPEQLASTAQELAEKLLLATHQHSVLIVGDYDSTWITRREENKPC